ncbi:hypothetical protein LJR153_005976 [Paenibacillus sp. LjRoot153]|uniref:hypothetical protein n=1 Tax=Paenibacillus sp. LjRoot153 TaxID=3342270 RepID=UPI003ECC52F2
MRRRKLSGNCPTCSFGRKRPGNQIWKTSSVTSSTPWLDSRPLLVLTGRCFVIPLHYRLI